MQILISPTCVSDLHEDGVCMTKVGGFESIDTTEMVQEYACPECNAHITFLVRVDF